MKVSLNWLAEFVELPQDTATLCELLTLAGVEVEDVETRGVAIDKVVVAQILESVHTRTRIASAFARWMMAQANHGRSFVERKTTRSVTRCRLAQPGALLPGDFKIKVGKLRGVESHGMLCSGKELGIPDDADGLLILPERARVGAPLSELYPADIILDLEITPNRADLFSYTGIAREVAALTKKDFKAHRAGAQAALGRSGVRIDAIQQCPFYSARKITGVKAGPSPAWLKRKNRGFGYPIHQ